MCPDWNASFKSFEKSSRSNVYRFFCLFDLMFPYPFKIGLRDSSEIYLSLPQTKDGTNER